MAWEQSCPWSPFQLLYVPISQSCHPSGFTLLGPLVMLDSLGCFVLINEDSLRSGLFSFLLEGEVWAKQESCEGMGQEQKYAMGPAAPNFFAPLHATPTCLKGNTKDCPSSLLLIFLLPFSPFHATPSCLKGNGKDCYAYRILDEGFQFIPLQNLL